MHRSRVLRRVGTVLVAISLAALVLACNIAQNLAPNPSDISSTMPRWACPSVTPLPYGPEGPPKRTWEETVTNPDGTISTNSRREDYVVWEQEYGGLASPPPPPTPYTKQGDRYYFGEIVNFAGGSLDVTMQAEATNVVSGTDRLYQIEIAFHNYGEALPFAPARQLVVSRISREDGRQLSGAWRLDVPTYRAMNAERQAQIDSGEIRAGNSLFTVPVYAPDGEIAAAELQLDVAGASLESTGTFRVTFIPGDDDDCSHAGTQHAVYQHAPTPIIGASAPPGTDQIVAFALSQVGRQYCWGGKGFQKCTGLGVTPACADYPCWDCSGLTWGAYNSVGITIGHGTANQQNYPPVSRGQVQPGDLLLFGGINQHGRGQSITHVGVYAGDLNGDGTGDMVHSANYPDGVLIANNVFGNRYYGSRLAIITRPPRGVTR